ncbi:hypothetical protein HGT73_05400 [Rosenbergiella australiborealis]|uniref:Uncharacterized protein n=1 Tax=Rosenbergiella australiborealis TaxID=1544696 RepID=A0ABS5T787_9GAMM|nr:hypothetical protein [Rosenbergiella australiborealis]MBT0726823.1 hypothetical protein [Rosenbergiella australiborealis]
MNSHNNWQSWVGNGITTLAAALGISTLELSYLVIAILGFLLSYCSWWDRRQAIRAERQARTETLRLDRQRTRAVIDYLSHSEHHDLVQTDEVLAKVQRVLKDTELKS